MKDAPDQPSEEPFKDAEQPLPDWIRDNCPELPRRMENIVAEWNLNDFDQRACVARLLLQVRQAFNVRQ